MQYLMTGKYRKTAENARIPLAVAAMQQHFA